MVTQITDRTVRRNITLDTFKADMLETVSNFTGRTQGEIIEIALNQPIMCRLEAFANPSESPLVDLLETYQVYEGHMNPRIGESILQAVKEWIDKHAVMKNKMFLKEEAPDVNSYIYGHMTEGSMLADPYFSSVYDQARKNSFIHPRISADELKGRIIKYINAMLAGPSDKNRMGEAYLFRNLIIILSACYEPPTKEDTKELFEKLSDGYVLPFRSAAS